MSEALPAIVASVLSAISFAIAMAFGVRLADSRAMQMRRTPKRGGGLGWPEFGRDRTDLLLSSLCPWLRCWLCRAVGERARDYGHGAGQAIASKGHSSSPSTEGRWVVRPGHSHRACKGNRRSHGGLGKNRMDEIRATVRRLTRSSRAGSRLGDGNESVRQRQPGQPGVALGRCSRPDAASKKLEEERLFVDLNQ
jgi:hypothetical protein